MTWSSMARNQTVQLFAFYSIFRCLTLCCQFFRELGLNFDSTFQVGLGSVPFPGAGFPPNVMINFPLSEQ